MDFDLPQENADIYEEVKLFCDEELRPRAREVAERGEFPWENWAGLAQMGLLAVRLVCDERCRAPHAYVRVYASRSQNVNRNH